VPAARYTSAPKETGKREISNNFWRGEEKLDWGQKTLAEVGIIRHYKNNLSKEKQDAAANKQ